MYAINNSRMQEIENTYGKNYVVIYWANQEARNAGESDTDIININLKEAIRRAIKLVYKGYVLSSEVRSLDQKTVIFFCGPDINNENYIEEILV